MWTVQFLDRLVLSETGENTFLDFTTTVFSALGTAFTPINTVHAMTAGSSISSGFKTALDSNFYAKATIGNYAQAIQATYYKDIKAYTDTLAAADANNLVVPIEVGKIQAIHKECSLAAAQSTISSTLQAAKEIAIVKTSIKVLKPGAGTETTLIATSPSLNSGNGINVTYKKAAGDTTITIANGLKSAVNSDKVLGPANVSATAVNDTITITSPATLNLQWKVLPGQEGNFEIGGITGQAGQAERIPGAAL